MSDSHIITQSASQYFFERQPPYSEENLKRATGEQVKVEYVLNKREVNLKTVKAAYGANRPENEVVEYEGPLDKEHIAKTISKIFEKVPDFVNKTETERLEVVSDIIRGKYDEFLFSTEN